MNTFVKSMLGDDFPGFNFLYSIYHVRFGALISLLLVYWTRILFLKHIYLHWWWCSAYRVLYILNWIYRYFTEPHFVHWISMNSLHLFSVPMMMGATSIHAATAFCFCQCRLGCRNCANSVVCWLLLLLYNEVFPSAYLQHFVTVVLNLTVLQTTLQLEEQCEARASSLSLLFACKVD